MSEEAFVQLYSSVLKQLKSPGVFEFEKDANGIPAAIWKFKSSIIKKYKTNTCYGLGKKNKNVK